MKLEIELTQSYLKQILHYDAETGLFTWLVPNGKRVRKGDMAGCLHGGRVFIRINKVLYVAHRLAWLYVHGYLPSVDIDHCDGIASHNWLSNLREATRSQNMQNQRRAQKGSASGLLGVYPSFNKWIAKISVDGQSQHLGTFPTPELAHAAYLKAKSILHPFQTLTCETRT